MNSWKVCICLLALLSQLPSYLTQNVRPLDDEDTGGECQQLAIPGLCDGVGYTSIYLPNFRGHTTQEEAAAELDDFMQLIDSGCSPAIRQFLCSYYLPFCFNSPLNQETLRLRPCRSLCEEASANCSRLLEQNSNYTWPTFFDCSLDSFPCGRATCFGPNVPCDVIETTEITTVVTTVTTGFTTTVSSQLTILSLALWGQLYRMSFASSCVRTEV